MNDVMKCLCRLLTAITALYASSSAATSLQVTPITLFFNSGENAKGIYLANSGSREIRAQLRLYRWSQDKGQNVMTEADNLVASPPLAQIPAGKTQLVRMLMLQPLSAKQEESWRLIVDELPTARAATETSQNEVNFLLRYSVPVFAGKGGSPDLNKIHIWLDDRRLWVKNDNPVHIKLSNVRLQKTKQTVTLTPGLLGYVLAGKEMSWAVGPKNRDVQKVEFSLNDSPGSQLLPVQAR